MFGYLKDKIKQPERFRLNFREIFGERRRCSIGKGCPDRLEGLHSLGFSRLR